MIYFDAGNAGMARDEMVESIDEYIADLTMAHEDVTPGPGMIGFGTDYAAEIAEAVRQRDALMAGAS